MPRRFFRQPSRSVRALLLLTVLLTTCLQVLEAQHSHALSGPDTQCLLCHGAAPAAAHNPPALSLPACRVAAAGVAERPVCTLRPVYRHLARGPPANA